MKLLCTIFLIILSNFGFAQWVNLNTGIQDELTGVSFSGNNGLLSSKKGLYCTTNGGSGASNWVRFDIYTNTTDKIIYNQTQFYHSYYIPYYSVGTNTTSSVSMFACGKDTVNGKAVLIKVNFPSLTYKILYVGASNSALNNIGFNDSNNTFYGVGDNGLIVSFTSTSASAIVANSTLGTNLKSIDMGSGQFCLATDSNLIFGMVKTYDNSWTFKVNPPTSYSFKDVSQPNYEQAFAVGKTFFYVAGSSYNSFTDYDYGQLNANCIENVGSTFFIGTDHGIFMRVYTNNFYYRNVLEWQPSSKNYHINNFWNDRGVFYACGKNGVLLKSNNYGGPPKPYSKLKIEGVCKGRSIYFDAEVGTANDCNWYLNDKYLKNGCNSFFMTINTVGGYNVKLYTYNNTLYSDTNKIYRDTSFQTFNVVEYPDINKNVTISKSVLCQEGTIVVGIESSQQNVFYTLKKYGSLNTNYGNSTIGNNGKIVFTSKIISTTGGYYLQANSSIANCVNNFTDTIKIKVEKTKADFHSGTINAAVGERVDFFQICRDANHFKWTFPTLDSLSILEKTSRTFSNLGDTQIKLECWSDSGCYDTIQKEGPYIYQESTLNDTCWSNVNTNYNRNSHYGTDFEDITDIYPSKTGYLVCGKFYDDNWESQQVKAFKLGISSISGGYLAKYNLKGTLKWKVFGNNPLLNYDIGTTYSTIEDNYRNIYLTGVASGFIKDNTGTIYQINRYGNSMLPNYLIKLDSLGKVKWRFSSDDLSFRKLTLDNSNNLIIISRFDLNATKAIIRFNNNDIDTITPRYPGLNYVIFKINPNGQTLWKAYISIEYHNGADVTNIGVDQNNNIYVTGFYEEGAAFYSANGLTFHSFGVSPYYGGADRVMFLTKYDSTGTNLWAMRYYRGNQGLAIYTYDMVTDNLGNCYITGSNGCYAYGITSYFENSDGSILSTDLGQYYLAKVNSNGICQWIQGSKYAYNGYGYKVTKLGSEISVMGQLLGSSTLYQQISSTLSSADNRTLPLSINGSEYFIADYDLNGNLLRIQKNGSNKIGRFYSFSGLFRQSDGSYFTAVNMSIENGKSYNNFGEKVYCEGFKIGLVSKFKFGCGITASNPRIITENEPTLIENQKGFKIFPNPVDQKLSINGLENYENIMVKVVDSKGVVLLATPDLEKINFQHYNPGLYILLIFSNGTLVQSEKIIKE